MEASNSPIPPTSDEAREVTAYLRSKGAKPAIIGSVGIAHYLWRDAESKGYRPACDLDIWVEGVPSLQLAGWQPKAEVPGIASWISPGGGHLDLLKAGHEFQDGSFVPRTVAYDEPSLNTDLPVAHWLDLLKMKLWAIRDKDLSHCLELLQWLGRLPDPEELGELSHPQQETFGILQDYFRRRLPGASSTSRLDASH